MQLINISNKGFEFLWYIINVYNKYAWVVPLKDRKGITIINVFQKKLNKANPKPNKIWVDEFSKLYNRSMKSWLHEMYSTFNKRKFVAAEKFIRILKNKIYK